jgi:hypothetical protein
MQETTQLNTLTNIVFVLTDVLETNLLEMQQQYKKEGFELGTIQKETSTQP